MEMQQPLIRREQHKWEGKRIGESRGPGLAGGGGVCGVMSHYHNEFSSDHVRSLACSRA